MSVNIKLVRIDQRLLHATVALNWNSFVNANFISVVDPKHADDPFFTEVIKLSFPDRNKVEFFSVKSFISFINEPREEKLNLMIIFENVHILREAVDLGLVIKEVQTPYPASRYLLKKIEDYFSKEELADIRALQKKKIRFYFQTTPYDTKEYSVFKQK